VVNRRVLINPTAKMQHYDESCLFAPIEDSSFSGGIERKMHQFGYTVAFIRGHFYVPKEENSRRERASKSSVCEQGFLQITAL
jgi:hypothetical protein